ncbi:cell division protein FtsL [Gracilibacillus alcaliphilus]|uniref:cell division protein FtsL n=1 Tax=Gracilibacillus alcaliphilus TaxID=1401441 RepID=UPI00195852F8|nr:cell division protein FtsL [Gracilibacillus alcaliphilus]MBM7678628.1 cell division protein FtsL [Gracilibacillus alcaliphilus]
MSSQHARDLRHERLSQPVRQPKIVKKKVKVQKRWVTPGEKIMYAVFAVIFLSISAYIVSYSSSLDQLNREVETLNNQVEQQSVVNTNLSFQIKELSQPERIIENAKSHGLKIQNTKVKQANELTD